MAWSPFLFVLFFAAAFADDTLATTQQLIARQGYTSKDVNLVSAGFTLSVQHIAGKGTPIILQHGLLDTTATWVINDKSKSLAFILADAGHDVWLVNTRGNKYSGVLITNWDWTFDDEARDIATAVDHVFKVTNTTPIVVAHSQGATMSLIALSRFPKVRTQVRLLVALAPVTYLSSQKSPLFSAMARVYADRVLSLLPNGPFAPTKVVLDRVFGVLCKTTPILCNFGLETLFGPDVNLNKSRMGVYTAHWPDITSLKNMIHWIKNARNGQFEDFFGVPYLLGHIKTPISVFSGTQDYLADVADVEHLKNELKSSLVHNKTVVGFAHMDFVWSEKAATLVYPDVLALINKYKK